jgi:predicted GIY-YIG superfamily endonuclease
MQGIYLIRNKVNGKTYVGQSVQIEIRWKQHLDASKNEKNNDYNNYIYKSFRKYGVENFEFVVLEFVEDNEKLTKREQYWYEIIRPNYNMERPIKPEKMRTSKPVYKIDAKNGEIIDEYPSIREASRQNNITKTAIYNVLSGTRNTANGYYWIEKRNYKKGMNLPVDKGNDGLRRNKILVLDKNTMEVKMTFDSNNECARFFGVSPSSIRWRWITKDFNSDINGYYFRREKNDEQTN